MRRFFIYINFVSVFIGYLAIIAFVIEAYTIGAPLFLVRPIAVSCGGVGLLTGLVTMVDPKAQRESIAVAVSTIAAFVLLLFAISVAPVRCHF
jgi:hypothetical protein